MKTRVLIACEFSGVVREAFNAYSGIEAMSCDILPAEDGRTDYHLQMDVFQAIKQRGPWDMMIAFPPCTHLCVSGARWFKDKVAEQRDAIEFFMRLANASVPRIAIENPISIMSTKWRKPDQIVQPWMFGHGEVKATCLWLKNLPKLAPTNIVAGREARIHRMAPSEHRGRERSRTYTGVAAAMAAAWSDLTQ